MKKLKQIRGGKVLHSLVVVSGMAFIAGLLSISTPSVSALGNFSLTRSAASVQNGKTVSFTLRINPGTPITGVTADIQYDASKLSYVSTSFTSSAFDTALPSSGGNGTVTINRGSFSSVNSNAVVAVVTFRALAGSGSTNLSVTGDASFSGNPTGPSGASSSVTLTSPQAQPPTNDPKPTPTNPTNPSSPADRTDSTPKPVKPEQPEVPTAPNDKLGVNMGGEEIQYTKAKLMVSTTATAKVYVKYGVSEDKLIMQTRGTSTGKNHEVVLEERLLIPGTTYYYQVIAETPNGVKTVKEVASFKTKGYTVEVTALDKNNKPLKNRTLTMRSDPLEGKTDKNGKVVFSDASPGKHSVEYEAGGKTYVRDILVDNSGITDVKGVQTATPQAFAIIYDDLEESAISGAAVWALVGTLVLVAGIVIVSILGKNSGGGPLGGLKRRFAKQEVMITGGGAGDSSNAVHQAGPNADIFQVEAPKQEAPGSLITPDHKGRSDDV